MLLQFVLAFVIGFVSAALGAVTTGANLISIPSLIFLGISPLSAIATTRLSAVTGGVTTVYKYARAKAIIWRYIPAFLGLAIIAGIVGPHLLFLINPKLVEPLIGALLLLMLPLLFLKPDFGVNQHVRSRRRHLLGLPVMLVVLTYGTAFGIGGGVFSLYTLIYFFGMTITEATATSIVTLILSSATALITYAHSGQINFAIGIPLMLGSAFGGNVGAGEALKHGTAWVRIVLVLVILVSGLKLLL